MKKVLLIFILIFWVGLILFLSFQTGTDTADTSLGLTRYILGIFMEGEISYETMEHWHMIFRLWAHPGIFFFYAMLATGVLAEFVENKAVCFVVTIFSGIVLAVFSEVGKLNIPGRHCDVKEMGLNIAGLLVGSFIMLIVQTVSEKVKEE